MMKTVFSILLLIFVVTPLTVGQNDDARLNRVNEDNQRTGKWEIFYDTGELKETGTYVNGQRNGLWKTFYKSGTLKHEITYNNGIAKGPARFYYRDGSLWEEGYWNENHWQGEYSLYHANGKKFYEWHYNDSGRREGEQKYYHANGKLKYTGTWEDGNIAGELRIYNEKGQLTEKRKYAEGSFKESNKITTRPQNAQENPDKKIPPFYGTGNYTLQSLDGRVIKEGYFRDGILQDGKHFIYNEKDSLIEVRTVENGEYTAQ